MRNYSQAFFGYQFPGFPANPVGFTFNADQCVFKVPEKLFLPYGYLRVSFFTQGLTPLFKGFKRWGSIFCSIIAVVYISIFIKLQLFLCFLNFGLNQFLKFN